MAAVVNASFCSRMESICSSERAAICWIKLEAACLKVSSWLWGAASVETSDSSSEISDSTFSASSETFPDALSDSDTVSVSEAFSLSDSFTVSEAVSVWAAVWVSDSAVIQAKEEDITRADDTRTVATYFFSFPLTILFTSLKPFRVSWQDGLLFL